jgi:hypothetical protein
MAGRVRGVQWGACDAESIHEFAIATLELHFGLLKEVGFGVRAAKAVLCILLPLVAADLSSGSGQHSKTSDLRRRLESLLESITFDVFDDGCMPTEPLVNEPVEEAIHLAAHIIL